MIYNLSLPSDLFFLISLYWRLNKLLDDVEDEDNDLTDQLNIIIHPSGDGDGFDEDQPHFQN